MSLLTLTASSEFSCCRALLRRFGMLGGFVKTGSVDAPDSWEVWRAMGASLTTARPPVRSRLCAQPLGGKEPCNSALHYTALHSAALPCSSLCCLALPCCPPAVPCAALHCQSVFALNSGRSQIGSSYVVIWHVSAWCIRDLQLLIRMRSTVPGAQCMNCRMHWVARQFLSYFFP